LFTAWSVAPYGTSQWEIRYTVANKGTGTAPAFHVTVQQNDDADQVMAESLNVIAGWANDDFLASQTYAYDPTFLAGKLPAVGGTFTDTLRYEEVGGRQTKGRVFAPLRRAGRSAVERPRPLP
jgi:hypothetical protein